MNDAPSVSDDEDDDDFYENDIIFDIIIDKSKNIKTQVNAEEAVEEEEVNNKNDFLETLKRAMTMKTTHHMYDIIQE